jgi:Tol biopolymer transport system component
MDLWLKRLPLLAALVIVSPALSACSDSTGALPPDVDKMILFSAKAAAYPGVNALYGVMPDGTGLYRFPEQGLGQIFFPRRSPDRNQIAFTTANIGGAGSIWTMRADLIGAHTTYTPSACPNGAGVFTWSPSGDRMLVDCDAAQAVINVSDGTSYSLSQMWGRLASAPDWSPVGDKILYQTGSFGGDIYVANLDGSGATLVATSGERARWSPDGTRIAFQRAIPNSNQVIFIVNADGSGERQLTYTPAPTIRDESPAWSPDGSQLVFIHYDVSQPTFTFHLNVINADGTGQKSITPDSLQDILRPDW